MVTVQIAPVYEVEPRAAYLCFGVGQKARDHRDAGSDRLMPGSFIDAPSMDAFVALTNRLTAGRRVKAQSVVVSFSPEELDKTDEDDQRTVGAAAYEVASRAFPGAPLAVVVHEDGGAPHAHVLCVNSIDGHAIRENRTHWQLKRIADEVAREYGLSVIEQPAAKTAAPEWPARANVLPAFDRTLAVAIGEVLHDESISEWAAFVTACEARGIALDVREEVQRHGPKAGQTLTGLTFRMLDETGEGKPRVRRRKASSLSKSYSYPAITAVLDARRAASASVSTPTPVAAPSRSVERMAAEAHSAQRGDLVRILDRTLTAGLFASLDGWALTLARVGVTVLRAQRRVQERQRTLLAYQLGTETYPEDALPARFGGEAVEQQSRQIAALRRLAPDHAKTLPVAQLVALIADERPHRKRHRSPVLPQTPARERHLQRGLELG